MDLYEAIETAEELLAYWNRHRSEAPSDLDMEAIRILLEAARDKAGV